DDGRTPINSRLLGAHDAYAVAPPERPSSTAVLVDELEPGDSKARRTTSSREAPLHISPLLSALAERSVRRGSHQANRHQLSPEQADRQRRRLEPTNPENRSPPPFARSSPPPPNGIGVSAMRRRRVGCTSCPRALGGIRSRPSRRRTSTRRPVLFVLRQCLRIPRGSGFRRNGRSARSPISPRHS